MKARTNMNIAAGGLVLIGVLSLSAVPGGRAASAPAKVDSLDELYDKAKKEAGQLNLYASLSAHSIEVILPGLSKRFRGLTVEHTDASAGKCVHARPRRR